jgi:hypothetical protein
VPGALMVGAHAAARRFAGRPAPAAPAGGAEATIDPGANTAPDPAGLAARTGGFAIAPGERADIQGMLARDVPPEEIAAHPAIRRAVEEEQSRPRTSDLPGYGTPEFRAAREFNFDGQRVIGYDTAIERLANQARDYSTLEPAQQNRLAVIVLGAPASGKSTLSEKFAHDMRAAIVDSDDAKKAIPEFNGGIGSGAVQNESSAIGQEVLKKLTADGTNIVIPRVGTDVADIRSRVQELRGRGYSVALAYVDVAKDTAYRRMIGRFLNTGRIIPADYFDQVGKLPRETYLVLKEEGHFYDTAQFDANGPQGTFRRVDGEP